MSSSARLAQHLVELPNLRNQSLTNLARLIGVPIGGRKAELVARLTDTLSRPKLIDADVDAQRRASNKSSRHGHARLHRVLSMDMGIRNLAYCRLLVDREQFAADEMSPTKSLTLETSPLGHISVETWRRFPLSSKVFVAASLDSPEAETQPASRELFTPPILAKHTLSLLHALVLNAPEGPPDTILIERQRWRSGGHASIQEWTLRVNSVEAMLWSGLELLKDQGLWRGSVHAVDPGAVTRFWLGKAKEGDKTGKKVGTLEPGTLATKPGDEEGKRGKISLARQWIETGFVGQVRGNADIDVDIVLKPEFEHEKRDQCLNWEEGTQPMKSAFSLTRGTKKDYEALGLAVADMEGLRMGKKDDLADCLLQGVAWVKWEQNRSSIISGRAMLDKSDSGNGRKTKEEVKVRST